MATKDEKTDLQEQLRQPPVYAGTYEDQLGEIFDRIQNREPFQYDVNADPLYQQYKDQYIQGGKKAMQDTMGRAAALTGGYGSSYAQQVGQQTYGSYLQDLSAVIPELYGMAYDMHRDHGDDLARQYSLLGGLRDTEYNRWRDELSDYNYQQERERQREETEYNRRMNEENTAFSRQQTAYSNLVALIRASGYNPTDEELSAAGLSREAANALLQEYTRSITPVVSGGGGGGYSGGGGSRSSGSDNSDNKESGSGSPSLLSRIGNTAGNILGSLGSSLPSLTDLMQRTAGDRQVNINGQPQTINSYGEVRNGTNMTRGEVQREAWRAYQAGEITKEQYQTIISGLH